MHQAKRRRRLIRQEGLVDPEMAPLYHEEEHLRTPSPPSITSPGDSITLGLPQQSRKAINRLHQDENSNRRPPCAKRTTKAPLLDLQAYQMVPDTLETKLSAYRTMCIDNEAPSDSAPIGTIVVPPTMETSARADNDLIRPTTDTSASENVDLIRPTMETSTTENDDFTSTTIDTSTSEDDIPPTTETSASTDDELTLPTMETSTSEDDVPLTIDISTTDNDDLTPPNTDTSTNADEVPPAIEASTSEDDVPPTIKTGTNKDDGLTPPTNKSKDDDDLTPPIIDTMMDYTNNHMASINNKRDHYSESPLQAPLDQNTPSHSDTVSHPVETLPIPISARIQQWLANTVRTRPRLQKASWHTSQRTTVGSLQPRTRKTVKLAKREASRLRKWKSLPSSPSQWIETSLYPS
ncbi:hypothetical protein BC941DRAFT_413829, partial [Chlamydoabsidia padenii]